MKAISEKLNIYDVMKDKEIFQYIAVWVGMNYSLKLLPNYGMSFNWSTQMSVVAFLIIAIIEI